MLGTEGGEDIGGGDEGGGETTEESMRRSRRFALNRIREARFKELRMRYREVKDDLYFKILRQNNITEFTRNKRHVMLAKNIHYSQEPMFETLNAWREYQKTGKGPAKMKTLHETLVAMKLEDATPNAGDMKFENIKADMSKERAHLEEDVPGPRNESWTEHLTEDLSDGFNDVESQEAAVDDSGDLVQEGDR